MKKTSKKIQNLAVEILVSGVEKLGEVGMLKKYTAAEVMEAVEMVEARKGSTMDLSFVVELEVIA